MHLGKFDSDLTAGWLIYGRCIWLLLGFVRLGFWRHCGADFAGDANSCAPAVAKGGAAASSASEAHFHLAVDVPAL
jgi:hypothetical protein